MVDAFQLWQTFLTRNRWPEWSLNSKSTWYWVAVVSLVCVPGCSGCESKTSPAKSGATQSESSSATKEDSSEKQSEASGRAAQQGSVTEIQTARGEDFTADSDATSNADTESNPSSASKKSSKLAAGEGTAQQSAGSGSEDREGGRSGGSPGGGKSKSSSQTGKPSSPGEAVATAQTLKLRSDKAAAGKEYGQAFELATKAWETLQTFPKDTACREMASDLQRRLEELGTLANTQRGSDLKRDKPLIVR